MNGKFTDYKRKYLLGSIVKSVVCGISCGLIAAGAVLFGVKFAGVAFAFWWYIIIGVGAAAVGGIIAFLFLKPDDKSAAKRLDDDYALDERVQTALEFSEASGDVVELQRMDAEQKLGAIAFRRPPFSRIWQYFAVLVVAAAVAVAAIFVPGKPVEAELEYNDNTPREVTEFELASLRELIENVNSSKLEDDFKTRTVGELEGLISDLGNAHTEGQIKKAVYDTIDAVDDIFAADSYNPISASLISQGSDLGEVFLRSAHAADSFVLISYDRVEAFYSGRYEAVAAAMERPLNNFTLTITVSRDAGLATALQNSSNALYTAINSSGFDAADELYSVTQSYAQDLAFLQADAIGNGKSDEALLSEITSKTDSFAERLCAAIVPQSYHYAMDEFVGIRLAVIFGYDADIPELPPDEGDDEGGGSDGEDSDNNPDGSGDVSEGGGLDHGDIEAGSDDMVYDPVTGEYVQYKELMQKYNELNSLDELTEEQQRIVRVYHDILSGGFGD